MMERTQISLDPEALRRARRRAADLGISFAELVRRLLAEELTLERRVVGPTAVFDLGDSGGSDVATQKDRMLGEAAARTRPRGRR
jgi:hypothetical protein